MKASRLFLDLDASGEALSPCGCFYESTSAEEGEIAGADERLWGLGSPPLPAPLPPPLQPLSPFWGVLEGALGFMAFSLVPFVSATLRFFYVTFVLALTTFATVTTGDGTPEMVLMGHWFPIFSLLLSFQLQHTTAAMVAVRSMTGSSLVIDRPYSRRVGVYLFQA